MALSHHIVILHTPGSGQEHTTEAYKSHKIMIRLHRLGILLVEEHPLLRWLQKGIK